MNNHGQSVSAQKEDNMLISITYTNDTTELININSIYKVVRNYRDIYETCTETKKTWFGFSSKEVTRKRLIGKEELSGCVILTNEYRTRYIRGGERTHSYQERIQLTVKESYEEILAQISGQQIGVEPGDTSKLVAFFNQDKE